MHQQPKQYSGRPLGNLVIGLFVFGSLPAIAALALLDEEANAGAAFLGCLLFSPFYVGGIVSFWAFLTYPKGQPWTRRILIFTCCWMLLGFPIGTMVGVIGLKHLLKEQPEDPPETPDPARNI